MLVLAGVFEVAWAIGMKASDGFTRLWPTAGMVAAMLVSMWLLTMAVKTIPLGTAYAVWTGIGAVGTAIIGILAYGDPAGAVRVIFLSMTVVGIVGLSASGPG
jgi:quaternary ammonium compound-resistance protein SugE